MSRKLKSKFPLSVPAEGAVGENPFSSADTEAARKAVVEALTATRRGRAGKCPRTGSFLYEDLADYPTRLAAAQTALAFTLGRPAARAVIAHVSVKSEERDQAEFFREVFADPTAVASIRRTLDQIEGCRTKTAAPIEIESGPALPPESDVSQPPLPPGDGAAGEG